MDFSELDRKRIERSVGGLCRRLSAPGSPSGPRFVYEVSGESVAVYEERPPWRGEGPWARRGIARFRRLRSGKRWLLDWMRSDGRWHRYAPQAMPDDLASLVALVAADEYGAFLG